MKKYTNDYYSKLSLKQTIKSKNILERYIEEILISEFELLKVSSPIFSFKKNIYSENHSRNNRPINFDASSTNNIFEIFNKEDKWGIYFIYKNNILPEYKGIFTKKMVMNRDIPELTNVNSFANPEYNCEIVLNRDTYKLEHYEIFVEKLFKLFKKIESKTYEITNKKISSRLPKNYPIYDWKELKEKHKNLSDEEILISQVMDNEIIFVYNGSSCFLSEQLELSFISDLNHKFLNGSFLVYNEFSKELYPIASISYRVNSQTLLNQINEEKKSFLQDNEINKLIIEKKIKPSVNLKIYKDKFLLYLLGKCHISEIQSNIWDSETEDDLNNHNIKYI